MTGKKFPKNTNKTDLHHPRENTQLG